MVMMFDELSEPVPVSPRPPPPAESFFNAFNGERTYAARDEAMSKTSTLNKRRDDHRFPELSQSSMLNVRYVGRRPPASSPATSPAAAAPPLSTNSRMNKRYTNGDRASPQHPAEQNARNERRQHRSHDEVQSQGSDMDNWLDSVFDSALDHDMADLHDGRALQNRLRGGGEQGQAQVGRIIHCSFLLTTSAFVLF
jgi:hypothetical protein